MAAPDDTDTVRAFDDNHLMKTPKMDRTMRRLWGMTLAGVALGGSGLLFVRPYVLAARWDEESDLSGAVLVRAPLHGAALAKANLSGANLHGADLSGATLLETNLSNANLTHANLFRSNPQGANLRGANLRGANLQGAVLLWADLTGADLTGADFRGAAYDSYTHWPRGFDPRRHGAVNVTPTLYGPPDLTRDPKAPIYGRPPDRLTATAH